MKKPYFLKILFAFAVAALLLGNSANAQPITQSPFNCIANQGNPFTVRAQGVTELVGDQYITCTGGTPTPAGLPIPQYNIAMLISTDITSRLMTGTAATGGISEAILAIDDPFPSGSQVPAGTSPFFNAPTTQLGCVANNTTNCAILGTGGGYGVGGPYNGSPGHYNLFQGNWNPLLPQAITWTGVPIDAPGSTTRTIRITNVRANASVLGVSSTLIPTQIFELFTITGSQNITVENPQTTVGVVLPGISCLTSASGSSSGVTATEGAGVPSAFKPRTFNQYSGTVTSPIASIAANGLENVLGFAYNSESAFVTSAAGLTGGGNGSGSMGLADSGTELAFQFSGPLNGTLLSVPNVIYLYPVGTPVTATTGASGATGIATLVGSAGTPGTSTQLTVAGGTATATYEVLLSSPFIAEFAFLPSPGASVTTSVSFAPPSIASTADSTAPIPRFIGSSGCPVPIPSTQIKATASGLAFSRATGTFIGTITITNISGAAINGPFQIAVGGLTYGIELVSSPGNFISYLTVPVASLSPGQSATVKIQFQNVFAPPGSKINFTPVVYSGSF